MENTIKKLSESETKSLTLYYLIVVLKRKGYAENEISDALKED